MKLTQAEKARLRQKLNFSERQAQIVELLLGGVSETSTIAQAMGISPGTVKIYLHNIYAKTGTGNRLELVLQTLARLGYIPG